MKKKLLALLLCVAMLLPSIAYAAPLGGINFSASAVKDLVSAAAEEEEAPVVEEETVVEETPAEEESPVEEEIVVPASETIPAPVIPTVSNQLSAKTVNSSGSSNADYLELSKRVDQNATNDNEATLTLEAYATQQVTGTPTDVVLVLDQSGSMLHAANVDTNNKITYRNDSGNFGTIDLYIQDAMTWSEVKAELQDPKIRAGATHPGYYMVLNMKYSQAEWQALSDEEKGEYVNEKRLYALEYREDGKWYRYSSMKCGSHSALQLGQVGQHIEATEVGELVRNGNPEGYFQHCIFYKSVLGVTIDAMYSFMETIEGTDSLRVAVVGFAGPRGSENPYTGTGFFDGDEFITLTKDFDYSIINERDFFKQTNDETGMNELWQSWGEYGAKRNNTATNLGFTMAQELFDRDYTNVNANRIIILFSDGAPSQSPDTIVENLKAGKSADGTTDLTYIPEIYTIGPVSYHTDVTNLTEWATDAEHCFQPSINGLEEAFKKIAGEIVRKTADLGANTVLFDEITQSFTLPAALTNYLENSSYTDAQKAAEIKKHIKAYTATASANTNGDITFADKVLFNNAIIEVEKGSNDLWNVSVKNFDYTTNAVTAAVRENPETGKIDFYGKKLIVEIPIITIPGFLGGDNIYTNTTEAGIYDSNGKLVEEFERPDVDVAVEQIEIPFKDTKIYVSQAAELPHIANIGNYTIGGVPFVVDGIKNEFVNIVYTIYEFEGSDNYMSYTIPAGSSLDSLNNTFDNTANWVKSTNCTLNPAVVLTSDTDYYITCDVISANNGSNKKDDSGNPTVFVYKPHVTFKDSVIRWGESANYADNYVSVVWKHGDDVASVQEMGGAPTLSYTYDVAAGEFHADTPVKVTSVISPKNGALKHDVPAEMNIIDYTTFHREACNFSTCNHGGSSGLGALDPNFIVHLLRFDLVIGKTGILDVDNHAADNNSNAEIQSTVFTVTNAGTGFSMDVTINGNDTAKILDLPAATTPYTVTEKTDWSWRYDPAGGETKTVEQVTTDGVTRTVNFKNDRNVTKWLNGAFRIENVFDGIGQ